jgi:integrase
MGSIYRRGRKLWIQYRQHGRLIRESTGSDKERVAQRMLKAREGDVAKGVLVVPTRDRITFAEGAQDLTNDYTSNDRKSLAGLKRRVKKHLLPYFGGRRLVQITTADIRAFTAQRLEAKASNGEINRELAALKRIFRLAVQGDRLTRAPHVPMLTEHNVRTGFFEREQFEAVRDHLPEALRGVVGFAYITGWRVPSEVLKLEWRQVDFKAGTVSLDAGTTKNGEARVFPLTRELRALLEVQRDERDRLKQEGTICPYVFHWGDGRPIKCLYGSFRSACKAAGCPGRIPHDFRRTAVRNLVRSGVPERVAMQLTGHKTRSVFERYNIVSTGDLREAAAKLDAASVDRRDHNSDHSQGAPGSAGDSTARPAANFS